MSVFYSPNESPIKGLRSNAAPGRNIPGSGFFQNINNARWANRDEIAVRLGIPTALSSAIGSSGSFRGLVSTVFNNVYGTLFCTVKYTGNVTHIFKSTDQGVTWSEITATSGKYGDTTLVSDGSGNDYQTSFAQVHDDFTGKDVIVFQNGVNAPIVYDGTSTAKVEAITVPQSWSSYYDLLNWNSWIYINNPAAWSATNSGANLVLTDVGTADPNDYGTLSMGSGTTATETATLNFLLATPNWTRAKQIHVVVEASISYIRTMIYGLKFSAMNAGTPSVIFNPTDSTYPPPEVTPINGWPNGYVISYSPPDGFTSTASDGVRWEWVQSTSPASTQVVNILGLMATTSAFAQDRTGISLGGYQPYVTYYNSATRTESPELAIRVETPLMQDRGVRTFTVASSSPTQGVRIPNSPVLWYSTGPTYVNTTTTVRDQGVDTLRYYRAPNGSDTAFLAFSYPIASWGGASWSFTTGSAGTVQFISYGSFTPPLQLNYAVVSPGAFNQQIPIGRAMVAANTRLIVGAKAFNESGTYLDNFPRIMESRNGEPFRFSEVADPNDPNTAGLYILTGGSVQQFVNAPGVGTASSAVYCFTDTTVWSVNTHVPASSLGVTRIMSVGINAPNAVVERMGEIYFVDTSLRVRRLSDGSWISWDVDDKFQGIPAAYRASISAIWYNDRIYFSYVPTGQTTNKNILVYSELLGVWESDDPLPSQQASYIVRNVGDSGTYGVSADPRFIFLSSTDRKCYRYESGTTDLGSKIAFALTTGDLNKGYWEGVTVKRCGIFCDPATDVLTFTLTFKPDNPAGVTGGSATLTNVGVDYDWTYATLYKSATQSASGNAVSLALTASLDGGFRIYALNWEPINTSQTARGQ